MKFLKSTVMTCALLAFASPGMAAETGTVAEKPATKLNGNQAIKKPVASQAPAPGEIKALADGKTIADIYAESDQLKDKVVSLRAKVTKMNNNVMGKNWITLKDGTGTKPGIKIVATSQEAVKVGDVVIAKGKISTDVDLGRGYFYEVMMEEATFSPGKEEVSKTRLGLSKL